MANAYWVGGAPVVRQVSTITIANTWATSDVVRMTIGGAKDLLVTIGSAFGVNDVAAALAAAINAADATTGLIGTETRNAGGQEIPEFIGLSAAAVGAVVTITGKDTGEPFTLTAGETTAGTGTATAAAVTVASGPNHADNADNWLSGSLPASSDVLNFDRGDVDCLYGLTHFVSTTKAIQVVITNDWTGQLGLDPINPDGYAEYRTRFLGTYGVAVVTLRPGLQNLTSGGRLYIDFASATTPVVNLYVARNTDLSQPSVFLTGGDPTITVHAGSVVLEPDDSQSSNTMEVTALYVGGAGGNNNDLIVTGGTLLTWDASAVLVINSGRVTFNNGFSLPAAAELNGGETRLIGAVAVSFPAFNVYRGATLLPIFGVETGAVNLFAGAALDAREASQAWTSSVGATAYPGSAVYDPAGKFLFCAATALLELPGGKLSDITHDLPAGRIVDMTALA